MSGWNLNSAKQVRKALALLGFNATDTKDQSIAGIDHPFADTLRQYRHAKWLDGAYGEAFLRFVEADGRVYADWNQSGNEAGRASCSEPNLQGIPRDVAYRRAFVAPDGRVLLKADFATAHLRIAAKIAGEKKMLDAFQAKHDLHRLTAQALLGKAEVSKQDRQQAKTVAFGPVLRDRGQGAARQRPAVARRRPDGRGSGAAPRHLLQDLPQPGPVASGHECRPSDAD